MENIKISNFRKIKDTWDLDLAPITFFTGKNSSGKSSVLKGLMVLSDYGKTNNHFEIKLNGELQAKHNIKDYSSAINWNNNKKSKISFNYLRDGYNVQISFIPKIDITTPLNNEDDYSTGELESIKIKRVFDNASFELLKNGDAHKIVFDYNLLNIDREVNLTTEIKTLKRALENTEIEIKKYENIVNRKLALKALNFIPLVGGFKVAIDLLMNESKKEASEKIELLNLKEKTNRLLENKAIIEKKMDKANNDSNKSPNGNELSINSSFYLNELSDSDLIINNLIKKVIGEYFRLNKKKLGLLDIENEIEKVNEFSEQALNLFTFDISHLSPHRTSQSKLLIHSNNDVDINILVKDFVEKKLYNNKVVTKFIKKWISKENFDIGEDFRIVTYEYSASKIEILENGTWINLSDKGFGAGQVFSILLAISLSFKKPKTVYSAKGSPDYEEDVSIILIEEPEANLHPGLQSKLVDLFLEVSWKFGTQFIIETHSEYMIRKSQLLSLKKNWFKLYYFDDHGPYEMKYLANGKFDREFGADFTDVADNIEIDLYKANKKSN